MCTVCVCTPDWTPSRVPLCPSVLFTEWMEDSALAGAPMANFATNHQETYRDPPPVSSVPNAVGQKSK